MRSAATGAWIIGALLIGGLLAACSPRADDPQPRILPVEGETGIVTRVIDGDTVDVAGVGRIRLIGIDTPERGMCGYESATEALSVLVAERRVSLVPGAVDDSDRYGRLLRYVDTDEADAGLVMVAEGWAIARYDSRDGHGGHQRERQYVAADEASPDLGCYEHNETRQGGRRG